MRRLVWVTVVGAGVAAVVGCAPCSSGRPADAIAPVALVDGGMGDPCENGIQCSGGLACLDVYTQAGTVDQATYRACTQVCDGVRPCLQGFVCASSSGAPSATGHCSPACQTDTDCLTGKRAGTCVGSGRAADGGVIDGGSTADGGTVPGGCLPVVCGTSGGACPAGFTCQSDRYGGQSGCGAGSGNSGAPLAPPPGSWCGRVP